MLIFFFLWIWLILAAYFWLSKPRCCADTPGHLGRRGTQLCGVGPFLNGSFAEHGLLLPVAWRRVPSVYLFHPRVMKSKHGCLSWGFWPIFKSESGWVRCEVSVFVPVGDCAAVLPTRGQSLEDKFWSPKLETDDLLFIRTKEHRGVRNVKKQASKVACSSSKKQQGMMGVGSNDGGRSCLCPFFFF